MDVTLALNQRAGQLICIQITFVGVHMSGRFGQGADKLAALGYVAVVGVDVTGSAVKTGINTIIKTVVKSIVKTAVNDTIYGILDAAKLAGKHRIEVGHKIAAVCMCVREYLRKGADKHSVFIKAELVVGMYHKVAVAADVFAV